MRTIPNDESWSIPPENSILTDLARDEQKLVISSHTSYPHRTARGDHREKLLCDFLLSRVPQNVAICKGHVQDSLGAQTSEFDIILYNPSYRMVIAKTDQDHLVLPVESVVAILEVRTRLDRNALGSASDKIRELSLLSRRYSDLNIESDFVKTSSAVGIGGRESGPFRSVLPIPVFLLGFESIDAKTIAAIWEQHKHKPNFVVCLGQFALGSPNLENPDDDPILMESTNIGLAMVMLQLTSHLLHVTASGIVPDLIRYYRMPEVSDTEEIAGHD